MSHTEHTPIEIERHTPEFATAGQIREGDLPEIARLGFRALIANRPDGEGGADQPAAAALAAAARAQGLEFAYQPVVSSEITPEDGRRFAELFDALPKPVLAFCRSGARSLFLHRLAADRTGS
jgi:uncharacterized protein (TIGR01244 family)